MVSAAGDDDDDDDVLQLTPFAAMATGLCEGHAVTSMGERLHKPYGQIHTKLRNRLGRGRLVKMVHLHLHLRLHKTSLEDLATGMPLLEWAHAKEVQAMRAEAARINEARELAGEPLMVPGGFLEALLAGDD